MSKCLQPLIDPSSIAILGASADLSRLGGMPIALLRKHGFSGPIYPINPKYQEVDSLKCYPSIDSLPGPVDLIVIAVAASEVLSVVRQAAAKGIRAAVIFAAGFAETGEAEGRDLQSQLARCAEECGLLFAGPNCMGLGNLDSHAYSTFSAIFRTMEPPASPRNVALVAQSGSVCAAVYAEGRSLDVRFNVVVTTGNEACVEFSEYLEYLADRPGTEAIVGYIEGLRDGDRFCRVATRMRDDGRILALLKAGQTDKGAQAVAAHTASVAGSQAVYRAVFDRNCVVLADDILHLADIGYLAGFRAKAAGPRVAILTISGAIGALLADLFIGAGVDVPTLSSSIQNLLHEGIPRYGMVQNPVDLTGNIVNRHSFVAEALSKILASDEVDFVVLYAPAFLVDRLAESVGAVARTTSKLIAVISTGTPQFRQAIEDDGVPVFQDPTRAVRALVSLCRWQQNRRWYFGMRAAIDAREPPIAATKIIDFAQADGRVQLSKYEAKDFLRVFGVSVITEHVANSAEKMHREPRTLEEIDILQKPAATGAEIVVSVLRDPVFGPIMTVGLKSIWTELHNDIGYAPLPVTRQVAERLLHSLKCWPLLDGIFAGEKVTSEAVTDLMEKASEAALALGETMKKIEICSLVASIDGAVVVDASVLLTNR